METKRAAASGTIGLTGVGLAAISADHLLGDAGGPVGVAVAAFALLVGAGFVAGSVFVYRSDLRTTHVLRVAGWNLLGVVATTAVLALVWFYQRATGGSVTAPALSGAVVVGVSATAHVLIGVNDVRRIRAEHLADQREKATVVNRLIRHDLKHAAQVLVGLGERLTAGLPDDEVAALGERVRDAGSDLGAVESQMQSVTRLVEADGVDRTPVDLGTVLPAVLSDLAAAYPGADVQVHGADGVEVLAGDTLRVAVVELVENALEHGDPETAAVHVERDGDAVRVDVVDDGPGIPAAERELVLGEREVTQLSHSSGLGLWLSKWVVDAYGGGLAFPDRDGTTVRLTLDAA